mgnify:CR=1 FL=1
MNEMWYADYTLAAVIHYDGCRGCKIFGEIQTERDYDQRRDRPRFRLMNEVHKVAGLYLELAEAIGDRHFEIHLDINSDDTGVWFSGAQGKKVFWISTVYTFFWAWALILVDEFVGVRAVIEIGRAHV